MPLVAALAMAGIGFASPAGATHSGPWGWGDNGLGQVGDGTTTSRLLPTTISGLSGVNDFAGGSMHSLAVWNNGTLADTSDDKVKDWGSDEAGQLGDGPNSPPTVTFKSSPVLVEQEGNPATVLTNAKEVSGGDAHSVAVKHDKTVWAWGSNTFGELGNGTNTARDRAVQVKGVGGVGFLTDVTDVAAGNGFTLARRTDGTVVAWGTNEFGELGNGTVVSSTTPVLVNLTRVKEDGIAAGGHGLAIVDNGTPLNPNDDKVFAWGGNTRGQLGLAADDLPHPTPALVANGLPNGTTQVVASGAGGHSLALKEGNVWAWGANYDGQLGRGTTDQDSAANPCLCQPGAQKVKTSTNPDVYLGSVTRIAAGYFHSLAIQSGSPTKVYAWGGNQYGQLGNGSDGSSRGGSCGLFTCNPLAAQVIKHIDTSTTPATITYLTGVVYIAGGSGHSLAAPSS